jgi:hypothetical protein
MKLFYVFGDWRFYRFVFEKSSNLLLFSFFLIGWTMMFLYIICRTCCCESNEPKIIENGVQMLKLLSLFVLVFPPVTGWSEIAGVFLRFRCPRWCYHSDMGDGNLSGYLAENFQTKMAATVIFRGETYKRPLRPFGLVASFFLSPIVGP